MKNKMLLLSLGVLLIAIAVSCDLPRTELGSRALSQQSSSSRTKITVVKTNYRGWRDSWVLSNGKVEVVVVPQIGRVMQFRLKDGENPFWENRKLDGKLPNPQSQDWQNFGGDKTWPAPQSDWKQVTGREWPPPVGFDAMPMKIELTSNGVKLISAIDPFYGIQTQRLIQLEPEKAVMTISTTYQKLRGKPKEVGIWVITQLQEPTIIYAALPKPSIFPEGYNQQSNKLPADLKVKDGILSLTRSATTSHKIGCDSSKLLWVGKEVAMRIDAPRIVGANYPDHGSSAEIYTNPNPDAYVELEFLSPLKKLQIGKSIHFTTTYTLIQRSLVGSEQEVRKILH
jgi:hypothetical protein